MPFKISTKVRTRSAGCFLCLKGFLLTAVLFISLNSVGQDISIFNQKVSEGFLFNPSVAGFGPAQAMLSYRNNYSGVRSAPNNNYLNMSSPFSAGRFGAGLNLIQEKSSLLNSTYLSAAFAYHLAISSDVSLSMGLSADLNALRLGDDLLSLNTGGDLILNQYKGGVVTPDFSAGVTFRTRYVRVGAAMNHMGTSWKEVGAINQFTKYLTGTVIGTIPLSDGRSQFEPYLNYRRFINVDQIVDVGLFYNFDDVLILGLGARNFKLASASVGLTVRKGIFVGYSREQLFGNIGHYLGSTNEVIVRMQLPDQGSFRGSGTSKIQKMDDRRLMYRVKKKKYPKKYYQRSNKSRK